MARNHSKYILQRRRRLPAKGSHTQALIDKIRNLTISLNTRAGITPFSGLSKNASKAFLGKVMTELQHLRSYLILSQTTEMTHPKNKAIEPSMFGDKSGSLVSIRPCGKEYNNKTYLGFYIGEVALGSSIGLEDDKLQCNFANHNPAIFVPELGKIIYGCESWWGEIKSEADFKRISDEDIENVWYVQLWRQMMKEKESQTT